MTRKKRLAALIAALSRPGDHDLPDLAVHLKRSPALVRLDIDDLLVAGYPIEAGPDATLRMVHRSYVPSLTVTDDELNALRLAISRMPEPHAANLLRLLDRATPEYFPGIDLDNLTTDIPGVAMKACAQFLPILRRAIRQQHWTVLQYRDADGSLTDRRLHPLGLERWGHSWALVAWCMLRNDFRTFRLDRISSLTVTDEVAPHRLGRDLATFNALHRQRDD